MVSNSSVAHEVVLRNLKPFAPPFHRHIVRKKLLGSECRVGDQIIIYEVIGTTPTGSVLVTDETLIRFE